MSLLILNDEAKRHLMEHCERGELLHPEVEKILGETKYKVVLAVLEYARADVEKWYKTHEVAQKLLFKKYNVSKYQFINLLTKINQIIK